MLGSGSWGTALACTLARKGHRVVWWLHRPEDADAVRATGSNPRYLSHLYLPTEQLYVTSNLAEAVALSHNLLWVIPAAFVGQAVTSLANLAYHGKEMAAAIKGLEGSTGLRVSDWFARQLPDNTPLAVVAGPSHAEEVVMQKTTFLTVAHPDEAVAKAWQQLLQTSWLHVGTTQDVVGVEWAAALKNLYAVGVGMVLGLGYGDNYLSVFVTACLAELEAFLQGHAPGVRHMSHSAYLGDLLVTAYSPYSRNRQLGIYLGEGMTTQQAQAHMRMVAEGYFVSKWLPEHTHSDELPLAHGIYRVLQQGADPGQTLTGLLQYLR